MVENIIYTGNHLVMWQRQCIFGIQNRELRHDFFIQHLPFFHFLIGQNACTDTCQDHISHIRFYILFWTDHRISGHISENLSPQL